MLLGIISISFSCVGEILPWGDKYERLEVSNCQKINCLFRTSPGDMQGSYMWVESFFPVKLESIGKLNRIYVGQEVGNIEVLRVPIEGYVSGDDAKYISGFRVEKKNLKQVFVVVIYGAEGGRPKKFKIENFQSLL
jgi:hypothetical protein